MLLAFCVGFDQPQATPSKSLADQATGQEEPCTGFPEVNLVSQTRDGSEGTHKMGLACQGQWPHLCDTFLPESYLPAVPGSTCINLCWVLSSFAGLHQATPCCSLALLGDPINRCSKTQMRLPLLFYDLECFPLRLLKRIFLVPFVI